MNELIFPYKVRIHPLIDEELRASLPENLRESAYTFQVEGSNVNLDFYYTHMTRRSLTNFGKDATNGVQFLDSHDNRNLGYGRSFGGRVRIDSERTPEFSLPDGVELATAPPNQYAYFQGDIYTIPGIRFGGGLTYASTDDFIKAVDAGLASDVSIGFSGGNWRCDICGGDYRSYRDCEHFAGNIYPAGDAGDRRVLATVSVDGARLHEISAVYDGATPNATIIKARAAALDGQLSVEEKRFLEVRYKEEIPTGKIFTSGYADFGGFTYTPDALTTVATDNTRFYVYNNGQIDPIETPNGRQANEEQTMDFEQIVEDVRGALAETGADESLEVHEQVRWLASEIARLQPLANDGRQYRTDLIADALKEGVRAMGEGFNQEAYRTLLENSSLEAIKQLRSDWAAVAAKRWPHGRQTNEGNEPTQTPRELVPDSAYT